MSEVTQANISTTDNSNKSDTPPNKKPNPDKSISSTGESNDSGKYTSGSDEDHWSGFGTSLRQLKTG